MRNPGSTFSLKKIAIFLAMELLMANVSAAVSEIKAPTEMFSLESHGRAIDKINISPDGRSWVFSECAADSSGRSGCHVAKYDLQTKLLYKYELPPNYLYTYPAFSSDGNSIILTRMPKHDGNPEAVKNAFASAELLSFTVDGKHFKIYPASAGRKVAPFMSPDGKKIAFWRPGRYADPSAKIRSLDFDIFELDIASGQEQIFSGPHHFVQVSAAQYLTPDTVIASAYAPHEQSQNLGDYLKKNNYSEVYLLPRGETATPSPAYTDIAYAANAAVDNRGGIYFTAQARTIGISLCKQSDSANRACWQIPVSLAATGLRNITADPAGGYIVCLYVPQGMQFKDSSAAVAMFYPETNAWRSISIPKLSDAASIPVNNL